jgi:hypothetical protein
MPPDPGDGPRSTIRVEFVKPDPRMLIEDDEPRLIERAPIYEKGPPEILNNSAAQTPEAQPRKGSHVLSGVRKRLPLGKPLRCRAVRSPFLQNASSPSLRRRRLDAWRLTPSRHSP